MLNEHLRKVIEDSLRRSCQDGDDAYDIKCMAQGIAIRYGRENGLLSDPLSDEDMAAVSVAVDTVIRQTPRNALLAAVSLEFIAENYHMYKAYQRRAKLDAPHAGPERYGDFLGKDKSRPWIAQITGFDLQFGFQRSFVHGQIDYSNANSNGSRGVYLHFYLKPGVYEINERLSWKNVRRRFIRVDGLEIIEMSREEVETWLRQD